MHPPSPGASPALIALWRSLVSGRPFSPSGPLDDAEVSWAIETGMGPLLYAAAREVPGSVPEELMTRLQAAERWARVRHAEMLEAAVEVIDRCADRAPPLTLLKGISIGGEHYPAAHQRILGDLDLLVDPDDAPAVTNALVELGYRHPDSPAERDYAAHHHLRPVRHPQTQICIEVHTGLFPPSLQLGERPPFSPAVVRAERRASTLEGRRVFRLSAELQVPYIASHWAVDFIPTAGARALLDMILLLRAAADRIDWARVLGWLDDRRIAASLHLMLSFLEARDLVAIPHELRASWKHVAVLHPAALRILSEMVDRYQIRGLMRRAPPIPAPAPQDLPSRAAASGSLRSRLRTLRIAATTRNLRGLLQPADTLVWEELLSRPRPVWGHLLGPYCLLFPPGDPDRLSPRHQLTRLARSLSPKRRGDAPTAS